MSLNAYIIQIDKIDDQLLELLEKRKLITKMVQKIKKKRIRFRRYRKGEYCIR